MSAYTIRVCPTCLEQQSANLPPKHFHDGEYVEFVEIPVTPKLPRDWVRDSSTARGTPG